MDQNGANSLNNTCKPKGNAADVKVKNDMTYFNELYKANLSGNSALFSNEGKPLGTRYFVESKKKLTDNEGNDVDTYYLIDNMKYGKDDQGRIDMTKYGLLDSVKSTIDSIDPDSISKEGFSNDNFTPVEITVIVDGSGNTETKSITLADYKKQDCTAFQDNCKKYKGMQHCDTCDMIPISDSANASEVTSEDVNALIQQKVDSDPKIQNLKRNMKNLIGDSESFGVMKDFEPFYTRYAQPLTSFRKEVHSNGYTFEIEKINEEKIVVEKNMTTTLWIGSVSLIGLFVLSKYL
jgi:hypothetical protein